MDQWALGADPFLPDVAAVDGGTARICIASRDVSGPVRHGGIGVVLATLAEYLAAAGHEVTLLNTLGTNAEDESFEHWRDHYAARGVTLEPLPSPARGGHMVADVTRSYEAYRWLAARDGAFDVILFPDWRGHGFHTTLGKHFGLAFQRTTICIGLHSPHLWCKTLEGDPAPALDSAYIDFIERRTLELADVAIGASQALIRHLRERGWTLPARTYVWPNIFKPVATVAAQPAPPIDEIVFFGRLEWGKGIGLFCEAVRRVAERAPPPFRVTFLGRSVKVLDETSAAFIERNAANWPVPWRIIDDYGRDAAVDYLCRPGRLAVVPSLRDNSPTTVLEALHANIPLLACATGGIPELIHADDVDKVCVAATAPALADALAARLGKAGVTARPRFDQDIVVSRWIGWFAAEAESVRRAPEPTPATLPSVTVCLLHYNRGKLLRRAVDSLLAQEDAAFEVVLVDDGSSDPAALAELDSLEPLFAERGWQLIRTLNRGYLSARNTAAAAATGEYLLLMDDDNIACPREISTFARAAAQSGADVLTCVANKFTGDEPPADGVAEDIFVPTGGPLVAGAIENSYGDMNAFVRRATFEALGGFRDLGMSYAGDWELFARAQLEGYRVAVVPEPLYWYRRHDDNMVKTMVADFDQSELQRTFETRAGADLFPAIAFARDTWREVRFESRRLNMTRQRAEAWARNRERALAGKQAELDKTKAWVDNRQRALESERDEHRAAKARAADRQRALDAAREELRRTKAWAADRQRALDWHKDKLAGARARIDELERARPNIGGLSRLWHRAGRFAALARAEGLGAALRAAAAALRRLAS